MIGIVLIGTFYYLAANLAGAWTELGQSRQVAAIATVSIAVSSVVHELQKERGLSAGFISSRGERFKDELESQQQSTDKYAMSLKEAAAGPDAGTMPRKLREALDAGIEKLAGLPELRRRISAQQAPAAESFALYTDAIDHMLVMLSMATAVTDRAEIARKITSYVMFISAKEQAGRERATINAALAANVPLAIPLFQRLQGIITAQDVYLASFRTFADPASVAESDALLTGKHAQDAGRMRDVVIEKALQGDFGLEPSKWFATITTKIDAMKLVEDNIARTLKERVAHLERAALWGIGFCAGFGLLLLIIAAMFFRLLTGMLRRINQSVESAQRLANGDLTINVAAESMGDRRDEIDELLAAMATMQQQLAKMLLQMKKTAEELSTSSARMTSSSQELASSSIQQTEATMAMASAIQEITASIATVSDSASNAHSKTMDAGRLSAQGAGTVRDAVGEMRKIAQSVGQSTQMIRELDNKSAEISNIVRVIQEIADQTNLLALNAAIEAARAGEQGRGFAVVADEVRKLAERTSVSTQEIAAMIGSIQQGTQGSVQGMDLSNAQVLEGMRLAEVSAGSMNHIETSTDEVREAVNEISAALREQTSAANQLAEEVERIAQRSEKNSFLAKQSSGAARNLEEHALRLNEAVERFRIQA